MSPIPPDKRRKVEFFYLETTCPLHLLTHTEYSNVTFGQTKLRTSNKRVLRDPGLFHAVGDLVKKKGVSRTAVSIFMNLRKTIAQAFSRKMKKTLSKLCLPLTIILDTSNVILSEVKTQSTPSERSCNWPSKMMCV